MLYILFAVLVRTTREHCVRERGWQQAIDLWRARAATVITLMAYIVKHARVWIGGTRARARTYVLSA